MERFLFENQPEKSNEARNDEEALNTKLHDSDLFDQNEDAAGETHDLATGELIDNSTYTGTEDLSVVTEDTISRTDEAIGDPADAWLRANDPNWGKK